MGPATMVLIDFREIEHIQPTGIDKKRVVTMGYNIFEISHGNFGK